MQQTTHTHTTCYHCGDSCKDDQILFQEKNFCCEGCKLVFEILNSSGLNDYYNLGASPGISPASDRIGEKFAWLDNQDILLRLIDFNDDEIVKTRLLLPDIHCSSCIWLLENLYKLDSGIVDCQVNFVNREVWITYKKDSTTLRKIAELLTSLGYEPHFNLADHSQQNRIKLSRQVIYKLGVAGFCFGNIMLLSFPEYLAGDGALDLSFRKFFGYLNILLSLPVVFYSGWGYLTSAYKALKHRTVNIDIPIATGISALLLYSSWEIISGLGAGYLDSLAGLIFFLLIGRWFQEKTFSALSFDRDYKSFFPVSVVRIKNNNNQENVAIEELKKGDCIIIRNNEIIPADVRLLEGTANIDYSFVTGEYLPVHKEVNDIIYAGGKQIGTTISLKVEKEVSKSYLSQLWNQEEFNKPGNTEISEITNKISRYFTYAILLISICTVIFWSIADPTITLKAFVSVLIIACPCALALAAPFVFGNTLRILGRQKLYLKNAGVIEKMARTDSLIFDKTGTLTENNKAEINYHGEELTSDEIKAVCSLLQNSIHPLSLLLYGHLGKPLVSEPIDFKEIPGKGLQGTINGNFLQIGSAQFTMAKPPEDTDVLSTKVYVNINHTVKGYFQFSNRYRAGLKPLLSSLGKKYKLHLLSGDNESERKNLIEIFGNDKNMHFQQSPSDKLAYIKELQKNGKKIIMIGDGLNDAGALKQSDVGIAISENTNNFTPASDAILDSRSLSRLRSFLDMSRMSLRALRVCFVISFLYNIIGLSFAVQGLLSPIVAAILMPLSSITIVGISILLTNYFARSLKLKC